MRVTRSRQRTSSSNYQSVSENDSENNCESPRTVTKSKRKKRSSETVPTTTVTPATTTTTTKTTTCHREEQIKEISSLLICHTPFVYITGPPNSGKSYCVDQIVMLVRQSGSTVVLVDMRDVLKVQGFYHSVLSQLNDNETPRDTVTSRDTPIPDHTSDFVRLLSSSVTKPCVVVVKHAHLLNQLNSLLFASVSVLHQLTSGKVSVAMISDSPWELVHLSNGSTLSPPVIVYIPPYSRLQMVDIIAKNLLREHSSLCAEVDFGVPELENYVRLCVYDTLAVYTSSLREMMTSASALLHKYVAPIQQGELKKTDKIKLFHRVQPELVTTMTQLSCVPSFKSSLELPYNSRVLLVCAFLASHNPARLDKRFFCKGKSSRRKVKSRKGSKLSDALKGPKTFPLDRLLAIHSSVTQDGTIPCSDILMSISSLVSKNLIVRVSVDLLEQPKYKCLAPLSLVQSLAKESGVDFEQFYYNY